MSSYRRIDYSIRPAKHAERRMMCDVFRRLRPFQRIEEYLYVGFGSVWFSDFILFHRALGIRKMLSIEQTKLAEDRFEENKPFNIPVDYRPSREALSDLRWDERMFLWLDYDDPLRLDMLHDLRTTARRARSGTVVAVTIQCSQADEIAEAQKIGLGAPSPIELFRNRFGASRLGDDAGLGHLYGWAFGGLCRKIIRQELLSELAARNSAGQEDELRFHPICDFEYEDGAKMTTVVGMFVSATEQQLFDECHFKALDFLPEDRLTVRINIPKLTPREFRKLESQLPLNAGKELHLGTIPEGEAKSFERLYRYLPNFAVLESN